MNTVKPAWRLNFRRSNEFSYGTLGPGTRDAPSCEQTPGHKAELASNAPSPLVDPVRGAYVTDSRLDSPADGR